MRTADKETKTTLYTYEFQVSFYFFLRNHILNA